MKRYSFFCKICLRLFGLSLPLIVWGQVPLEIIISGGIDSGRPIAVIPFLVNTVNKPETDVSEVITKDLQHSGHFSPIDIRSIPLGLRTQPLASLDYWRSQSIEAVITGRVWQESGQQDFSIEYSLWDVLSQPKFGTSRKRTLTATVSAQQLRQYAHRISDQIFAELTGISGAFSTKIAYINVNYEREFAFHLAVSDYDGYNPQVILRSKEPLMSPSWSPDGTLLAYVSFENKRSEIYIQNIYTRERERLTNFPRINGAPRWSPDGSKMAMVLSKDGQPNIYVMDLKTRRLEKLTSGRSIDTEPTWMPDGQHILFTSDRGGTPQIYQIHVATGATRRLTWHGQNNLAAAVVPLREQLVVVSRIQQDYRIARHDLDTGFMQVLTQTSLDESPTIAPNGSMIMYGTVDQNRRQVLSLVSIDGRFKAMLPVQAGDIRSPAWSPYINNS